VTGKLYAYGMTERGYAPGCQPKGVVDWLDYDIKQCLPGGKCVWGIIWYDRLLTQQEMLYFELIRVESYDS